MKKRKLMIVIEETGLNNGKGFNIYLSGDNERLGTIDYDQMSPAEFWGYKLFQICVSAAQQAGAVKTVSANKKGVH